jgi:hypothetical protein
MADISTWGEWLATTVPRGKIADATAAARTAPTPSSPFIIANILPHRRATGPATLLSLVSAAV